MAQVEMVLSFWLGPHDVAVLRGEQTSGTREVRFGHVGPLLRQFLYGVPKSGAEWKLPISPFEEKGIPAYELRVKCNPPSQERHGECTLPAQAANSRSPYPLWQDSVVPFAGEQPSQAIAIVRDEEDCFHLRLVGDADLSTLPGVLKSDLEERDEVGRLTFPPSGESWTVARAPATSGGVVTSEVESASHWLDRLKAIRGSIGACESVARRPHRSRKLVTALKQGYDWRCQLCDPDSPDCPRIPMRSNRYYVEVHHIEGLAETRNADPANQDAGQYILDTFENVVVVCAYHHRLLHHYRSPIRFDGGSREFRAEDGSVALPLLLNKHI